MGEIFSSIFIEKAVFDNIEANISLVRLAKPGIASWCKSSRGKGQAAP